MGFPDGGVGDMSSMRAADLIWQLQSVVNSDLIAEDAKLDLVKDYGSDTTVSHHGKWSRLSSKSDHQRSARIRKAFADALGWVTGLHVVESAGNAKLDDIIGMLTANNNKPLTKREVRQVLSNAGKFIDFGALRKALAADRKSCEKLPSQGDALMAKIGDFEQKVQRSKASFTKVEIDGFAAKYAEAQKLRAAITNDYNAVFKATSNDSLTYAEVMTALDGKKDADASRKPDDSLHLKTFEQLAKEKKQLVQELREQPKDDQKAKETKARYRAVVGELRQILRARDQEAEKIEQSIPKDIRDQLAVKDDFLKDKAWQTRFVNLVVAAFKDDLKGEKLTFNQAVEFVNREKQKDGLSEETAKRLEKFSTLALKMELVRSTPVRMLLEAEKTLAAAQQKKEQFLAQYRAAYPNAAKDIKFEDAVKALNEQKIAVPESLKDVDKMTLQQLKDKLTALVYDDYSELYPSDAWKKDQAAQESALTNLIQQKTLQQIAETTEKAVRELESSIPEDVRKAIADDTKIKPNLDQFLKTEPDGEGVDSAVGGEAVKLRSELLTEIETLKTELGKWSASLKEADAEAGRLVDKEPGSDDRRYEWDCNNCRKSLRGQGDALKTLQKTLDDLQSRYDATFVAPKKAAENEKRLEEVKKFQTQIDEANKDINGLRKQIDELKATRQKLTAAGGKEAIVSLDEAKELVLAMQRMYQRWTGDFEKQRVLPSDDNALLKLQAEISDLKTRIESNEKLIAEKWTAPIKDLEKQIAEKEGQVKDLQKQQDDVKNGRVKEPEPKINKEPEPKIIKEPEPKIDKEPEPKKEEKVEQPKGEQQNEKPKVEPKVEKQRQVKVENQQQVKGDIPSGKGIGFDAKDRGKFSIDLQWLANKDFRVDSTKIYEEIKTSIFGKIDKFDEWLDGECKQNVFNEYKSRGKLVKAFFDKAWAECKGDVLAQKLREVLSANKKEGNVLDCDTLTMKLLVSDAVRAKLGEEGLDNVVVAEPRLATVQQNKNDYLQQLEGEFQKWKVENFGPVKDILGEKSCEKLESAVQKDYDQLRDVIDGKTTLMDLLKSDNSEKKTFFNHLVTFFANEKKNADKSLFEVIREDLEAKINSYKLVDKEAKNIKPKLTMPSPNANNNDPRVTQDEKTSPQQLIQSLLKKDPKVGLIQNGSLSCWMISVVNGLLATKGGSEILEKCFKDPNQCVFNALTTEGGTKPITVSSKEIADVMAKNTGVSQLEAAIWKGVDKMAVEGGFGVKGCKLGEMGEATDVARLFGLRNAAMGTGRTVPDDNYTWVTGANALRGDKVVVLHARSGNNLDSGHFVTAIGTKFVDKGVKQGLAPEKSFFIQDSLTNWNTQTLNSDDLNVNGTTKDQSRFEVLAYEIPA